MRTPVSWIRAVVPDLPDVSTEELAAPPDGPRPQARGDRAARPRHHRPARRRPGAVVRGRAAEQRQDHPLVLGRRRRGQRHGRAPGHRVRRPQLRGRRPGPGDPARRRAARRLRDLRAQDLRPRVRRDDLLRQGARPRRRPRRHHRAARRRRRAGRRRLRRAAAARRGHRVRDQPRPRVRPVAARCRPRGRAGLRPRLRRPGRPAGAVVARRRVRGRGRGPGRLPGLHRPVGDRLRPGRADARRGWPGASSWPACGRSRWRST